MTTNPPATSAQTTGFWLTDGLAVLGRGAAQFLNNRLAYEDARDDIRLYELALNAQQRVAGGGATTPDLHGYATQQVAGVPAWMILAGIVIIGGALYLAAKG